MIAKFQDSGVAVTPSALPLKLQLNPAAYGYNAQIETRLMVEAVKRLLSHPDTRDLGIDDPRTTDLRKNIIQRNRFLWRIYDEWYRLLTACIPEGPGRVVELGSGAGFLGRYVPGLIASEVFPCSGIQIVLDARQLPFASGSLRSIAMVDVFHHIPESRAFFAEAQRCLRPGGSIVMIEPWVSTWSRFVYTHLHHEPFECDANDWTFPDEGPLSGANGALPWIVFERDRRRFESEYPQLKVQAIRPFMPFRYLVSGGVSMRQLTPEFAFAPWAALEKLFTPWPARWAMFALIHITRV